MRDKRVLSLFCFLFACTIGICIGLNCYAGQELPPPPTVDYTDTAPTPINSANPPAFSGGGSTGGYSTRFNSRATVTVEAVVREPRVRMKIVRQPRRVRAASGGSAGGYSAGYSAYSVQQPLQNR